MPVHEEASSSDISESLGGADTVAARRRLRQALPIQTGFEAFCIDCFPAIQTVYFAVGMDRLQRENLLLQHVSGREVIQALERWLLSLAPEPARYRTDRAATSADAFQAPADPVRSSDPLGRHGQDSLRRVSRTVAGLGLLALSLTFRQDGREDGPRPEPAPSGLMARNALATPKERRLPLGLAPAPQGFGEAAPAKAPAEPAVQTDARPRTAASGLTTKRNLRARKKSLNKEQKNERVPVVDTE